MRKVNVLLFKFNVENFIHPWFENERLYTICAAKKLKDIKQKYGDFKFELIFPGFGECHPIFG